MDDPDYPVLYDFEKQSLQNGHDTPSHRYEKLDELQAGVLHPKLTKTSTVSPPFWAEGALQKRKA